LAGTARKGNAGHRSSGLTPQNIAKLKPADLADPAAQGILNGNGSGTYRMSPEKSPTVFGTVGLLR